jgi:hypothetical protein
LVSSDDGVQGIHSRSQAATCGTLIVHVLLLLLLLLLLLER